MKKTLFILLFALLFENVFLGPSPLAQRIARVGKIFREKKLRELQSDESVDTDSGAGNNKVDADATAFPISVDDATTSSTVYNRKSSKSSSSSKTSTLKVNKFYNYHIEPARPNLIKYNTLFSFLNVIIVRIIKLRLTIAYGLRRLRNLDEANGESVPSTCTINNTDLVGKNGTGSNIKYDCEATATQNASTISSVSVDPKSDLKLDNITYPLEDVTFNGNSSEEAANLVETEGTNVEGDPIDIRDASVTAEENSVIFKGTVRSDEGASTAKEMYDGQETFTMLLSDYSSGDELFEDYDCKISSYTADGDNANVEMSCDTSSKTLKNPDAYNFDESLSIGDRVVTLHMAEGTSNSINWDSTTDAASTDSGKNASTTTDGVNNISYRKNSSGLSGGAIAGIVIACAVVLIAASIVAMMLRKPAPPLDNTTVVGLKTVDNY